MRISDTSVQDVELPPKSKVRRYLWLVSVLLLASVLVIGAYPYVQRWHDASLSISVDRLRIATVERGNVIRDIPVQGRVVAGTRPTLFANHEGLVTFVVDVGDTVTQRQVLAEIDNALLRSDLLRGESLLKQLASDVERVAIRSKQQAFENQRDIDLAEVIAIAARREAKRAELSYERQAISELDYRKEVDELQSAEVALDYARNFSELDKERMEFEQRAKNLEYEQQELLVQESRRKVESLSIRSPIEGVVGSLLVDEESYVQPGQALLTVVDLTRFELEADVPEAYAPELRPGIQTVTRTQSGLVEGVLIAVAPEVLDGQVKVRIRFDETPSDALRQNQRLSSRLLLERHEDVLTVARGPFLDDGGGRIAYVVEENGVAWRRNVVIGARSTSEVEVLSGIVEGERVVVSGSELFGNSDSVYIRQ